MVKDLTLIILMNATSICFDSDIEMYHLHRIGVRFEVM